MSFYSEMSQRDAFPVLLRAFDHGQTWLQTKAAMELAKLDIEFPADFEGKVTRFYESIDLSGLPAESTELPPKDRDRMALKVQLAVLILKLDRAKGMEILEQLSRTASQDYVRAGAAKLLDETRKHGDAWRER